MTDKNNKSNTYKPKTRNGQREGKRTEKGGVIRPSDNVHGNTTTSTGPRGPRNEKK